MQYKYCFFVMCTAKCQRFPFVIFNELIHPVKITSLSSQVALGGGGEGHLLFLCDL